MKIRKSILAAATAATVSVSGVVAAPAFAAEGTGSNNEGALSTEDNKDGEGDGQDNNDDETDQDDEKSFGEKLKENSSDDKGNLDPTQITAWIAVFTAVLGLIGTVLTFVQKNFDFPQF